MSGRPRNLMTQFEGRVSKVDVEHAHARGVCPHCRRALQVLERRSPTEILAGCRCGHRVVARARSGLFRLLKDRQEVTA